MADKDFTVGLKATGADQAASEIKKLDSAQDALAKNTNKSGTQIGNFSKAGKAATVSTNSMRFAAQNAAFQIQDMAVQLEMGTSASRVFSQQVPQLLGSFGAVGAIAGAVIGVGIPLATALFSSGKEAEDATPKIDALDTILETHKQALADVAEAKNAGDNQAWIASLDEEEGYYDKINTKVARQIALQAKLRALKDQTASAQREADIAVIEADPLKSEGAKVKEVAAIRQKAAESKAAGEKQKLADQAAQDAAAAAAAQAKADRQAADVETARKAREALEKKAAELDATATTGAEAGKKLPALEASLGGVRISSAGPGARPSQQEIDSVLAQRKSIQAQIDEAKKAAAAAPGASKEFEAVTKEIAIKKAAEELQKKEAEAARKTAEDAYGTSLNSAALVREGFPQIDAQLQADTTLRKARESASLRQIEDRQAAEEKRKSDQADQEAAAAAKKAEREALTQQLGGAKNRLAGTAAENEAKIEGSRNLSKALQGLANDIGKADTGSEITAVGAAITAKQAELGAQTVAALNQMLAAQAKQVSEIEAIKQKIRNL